MKEASRLFRSTGVYLIGTGDTVEAARQNLRAKTKAYRGALEARAFLKLSNPRDLRCVARPELADHLWKDRMKKSDK